MLRDIANSKNPLAGLVEIALREKGADLTAQTVARYEDLMASAIRMDTGEDQLYLVLGVGRAFAQFR